MKISEAIKTNNIIRIEPHESLSHALATLGSSHDAAFVFDNDKKLMGVINPYHCLIKTSNPGNAKVEHCLFHPPRLRDNYSVSKIAHLMRESKVHYLPVFDNQEKFVGIASARKLLAQYKDAALFNIPIKQVLDAKRQPLVTVYEDDLISHALALFKKHKISKLVVIDKNMKLRGVLTYYDLISFLMSPREKEGKKDRVGTRTKFHYHRVRNFAKSFALTMSVDDKMSDALRLILRREIGSVVIVDTQNHPYGIITTQDFLNLMEKDRKEKRVEIIDKNLSKQSRQIVGGFFNQFVKKVKKAQGVSEARLTVKEEKNGGVFKAVLSLIPQVGGSPKVIKKEGKNLFEVLKKIRIK